MENSLASRMSAVNAALLQSFHSTKIDKMELLSGGLSGSAVYKIMVNDRAYVLKLDASVGGSALMGRSAVVDRSAVADNSALVGSSALMQASEAGVAPRLFYRDSAAGITISDFIENHPIRAAFSSERLVSELAFTIRRIHAVPRDICLPGRDLQQMVEGMVKSFWREFGGPMADECLTYYEAIRQKYPWDDPDKVFSHNDINPGNLLCDGRRLWVIDWDAAFLNDRYVDLATAANFFLQTEQQEREFLHVYFDGAVDEYKTARFFVMRQVSRMVYSMLLVRVAARNKPAGYQLDREMEGNTLKLFGEMMAAGKLSMGGWEGQLMYGKAQMNEAVAQMRSSRFVWALGKL